ncbi:oleosin 18.2 kDa [Ricinus communis]|uniref:Oleosin n=1 Tax=Ricinus communis TaxID=3988 RepID=Q5VKJ9_RICCO|nr:oleosin 18.2 kDa [Ricinus communis]AAR15171.1 oleosin [Ricinus communis]EEF40948.1 Oleosin1 [Ricinus communis]|eukprot:XP_002521458.1 oleosin 18.2 kDa [Ricinus communis]
MADRPQPHQVQVHRYDPTTGYKGQQKGPSASKVLAVLTFLPVGGGLLSLSGITLTNTLIGMAIATPLFILFGPIILPAAVVIGLAMMAFMVAGALGLSGLTSQSWALKYFREGTAMPESLDQAKKRMQDMAGYVGMKTKEVGQDIQRKAQEGK